MNNPEIPIGTTVHINLEDIKWRGDSGDLISRSALKEELEKYCFAIVGFEGVLFVIENMPAVEYTFEEAFQKTVCENRLYCPNKRPKGDWIIIDDCEQFIAKCSICGRIEDSRMVKDYPFCHCGADMRGEEK